MTSFAHVTFMLLAAAGLLFKGVKGLIAPPILNGSTDDIVGHPKPNEPLIIPLRRESVPVKRKGKVVSFRTSYAGVISVGSPQPQMFRVVFDTGSAHMVLPAVECGSEACLVHKRYDQQLSETAIPINLNGKRVVPGKPSDRATIEYGTGTVKGEFVRDEVCLSRPTDGDSSVADADRNWEHEPCIEMNSVMAIEMSTMPFKNFGFDGIIGMGLSGLAIAPEYNFLAQLSMSGLMSEPYFGVFLTDGESEEGEIAFGGPNPKKLISPTTPLSWTPVAMPEAGYWQVHILAVRVAGKTLDFCQDGTCRGVMDT